MGGGWPGFVAPAVRWCHAVRRHRTEGMVVRARGT